MEKPRIFKMAFASVYPLYVQKAERKGRTRNDVDAVICWLTGYTPAALAAQIAQGKDFEAFFSEAPALHPNAGKITGVVCGVRVEEIDDPLMRKIRYLDKLVDELAKGGPWRRSFASRSPARAAHEFRHDGVPPRVFGTRSCVHAAGTARCDRALPFAPSPRLRSNARSGHAARRQQLLPPDDDHSCRRRVCEGVRVAT
jgi:hypothetical protein